MLTKNDKNTSSTSLPKQLIEHGHGPKKLFLLREQFATGVRYYAQIHIIGLPWIIIANPQGKDQTKSRKRWGKDAGPDVVLFSTPTPL